MAIIVLMKEELRKTVIELIQPKWGGEYALEDVVAHQYGYSLLFVNKKDGNRFSPTIISNQFSSEIVIKKSQVALQKLRTEIETALVKENISG